MAWGLTRWYWEHAHFWPGRYRSRCDGHRKTTTSSSVDQLPELIVSVFFFAGCTCLQLALLYPRPLLSATAGFRAAHEAGKMTAASTCLGGGESGGGCVGFIYTSYCCSEGYHCCTDRDARYLRKHSQCVLCFFFVFQRQEDF